MWMVRGPTEEYGMVYLPTYAGTQREVEEKVMEGARREGFKGTLQERLAFLEWEIVRGTFHMNRQAEPPADRCPVCDQKICEEALAEHMQEQHPNRGGES